MAQIDKIIVDGTEVSLGGSGEKEWVLLNKITVEEPVNYVYVNTDSNGNSFSVRDLLIRFISPDSSTNIFSESNGQTVFIRCGDGSIGDRDQYYYPFTFNMPFITYARKSFIKIFRESDYITYAHSNSMGWNDIYTNNNSMTEYLHYSRPNDAGYHNGFAGLSISEIKMLVQNSDVTFNTGLTIEIYSR